MARQARRIISRLNTLAWFLRRGLVIQTLSNLPGELAPRYAAARASRLTGCAEMIQRRATSLKRADDQTGIVDLAVSLQPSLEADLTACSVIDAIWVARPEGLNAIEAEFIYDATLLVLLEELRASIVAAITNTPSGGDGVILAVHRIEAFLRVDEEALASGAYAHEPVVKAILADDFEASDVHTKQIYRRLFCHLLETSAKFREAVASVSGDGDPTLAAATIQESLKQIDYIGLLAFGEAATPSHRLASAAKLFMGPGGWITAGLVAIGIGFACTASIGRVDLLAAVFLPLSAWLIFVELFRVAAMAVWERLSEPVGMARLAIEPTAAPVIVCVPVLMGGLKPCVLTFQRLASLASACARDAETPRRKYVMLSDLPDGASACGDEGEAKRIRDFEAAARRIVAEQGVGDDLIWLHRDRTYSHDQDRWIGAGRKSGKIRALYRLVSGEPSEFTRWVGDPSSLQGSEFVVVVDDDTEFSATSITELVRTIAHPLNRPKHAQDGRVIHGYGAVSPHLSPKRSAGSAYLESLAGKGLPGDAHVRDPEFELFGQRQFSGKGITRSGTALRSTAQAQDLPLVLSHDVIEGAAMRTGYCGSAVFFDRESLGYWALCARKDRWVRGDVQNLLMLLGKQGLVAQGIPASALRLALENVRRDVLPIAQAAAFCIVATTNNVMVVALGSSVLLAPLLTYYFSLGVNLVCRRFRQRGIYRHLLDAHLRELGRVAIASHLALVTLLAVGTACVRVVRRRRLLSWIPSSDVRGGTGIVRGHRLFAISVVALSTAAILAAFRDHQLLRVGLLSLSLVGSGLPLIRWPPSELLEQRGIEDAVA